MTGNDNVLKLECEKKDISVYELCIQMLNVLIHFLRKEKDEIPPRIKFPTIVILVSLLTEDPTSQLRLHTGLRLQWLPIQCLRERSY